MSENQSKQSTTPVDQMQHLTVGQVQYLQVEDDPSGPIMVCRMKVESTEALENFFLRLTNNQAIFETQLNFAS